MTKEELEIVEDLKAKVSDFYESTHFARMVPILEGLSKLTEGAYINDDTIWNVADLVKSLEEWPDDEKVNVVIEENQEYHDFNHDRQSALAINPYPHYKVLLVRHGNTNGIRII